MAESVEYHAHDKVFLRVDCGALGANVREFTVNKRTAGPENCSLPTHWKENVVDTMISCFTNV